MLHRCGSFAAARESYEYGPVRQGDDRGVRAERRASRPAYRAIDATVLSFQTTMLTRRVIRMLAMSLLVQAAATHPGFAQTEDLEPRIIGTRGTTLVGVSGSFGRFFSTEDLFAGHYTVQVDGHRFIFSKIAIRFGVLGSGTFSGESSEDDPTSSTPTLEALGGASYYFTPESMWSLYAGGEYRARLTERLANDSGSVLGTAGLQGVISSRASFFIEGGYGMRLRTGDEGEVLTRMVGQVGLRIRF
jgi:hypothetical protein